MPVAIALHTLAAVIWVGGMFFAYMALRPAAASLLEPPQRLTLWAGVFARFFPWVWLAVALLLASGLWVVFAVSGGMAHVGRHVHLMLAAGVLMMLIYGHLYFAPYRRLRLSVAVQDWPEAGRQLGLIRRMVGTNLTLGLLTVVLGSAGRYLAVG